MVVSATVLLSVLIQNKSLANLPSLFAARQAFRASARNCCSGELSPSAWRS
jgi:hypothetical protein